MPTRVAGGVSYSQELERAAARGQAKAVNKWMREVLELARGYAPVGPPGRVGEWAGAAHPGALRASGKIIEEASASAEVPYTFAKAAFDIVYATYQHEHLELEHRQGGGAKYLERAFKEKLPELPALVAEEVRIAIELRRDEVPGSGFESFVDL